MAFKHWAENSISKDKLSLEIEFEKNLSLKGLSSSSRSLFAASCIEQAGGVHWFIFSDREEAAYFSNDLSRALDEESVMFFPSAYKRSISQNEIDEAGLILRTSVLNRLKNIQKNSDKLIVVTFPEAIMEKVVTSESLNKNTLELKVGEKISIGFIREVLEEYHFEKVEFI